MRIWHPYAASSFSWRDSSNHGFDTKNNIACSLKVFGGLYTGSPRLTWDRLCGAAKLLSDWFHARIPGNHCELTLITHFISRNLPSEDSIFQIFPESLTDNISSQSWTRSTAATVPGKCTPDRYMVSHRVHWSILYIYIYIYTHITTNRG